MEEWLAQVVPTFIVIVQNRIVQIINIVRASKRQQEQLVFWLIHCSPYDIILCLRIISLVPTRPSIHSEMIECHNVDFILATCCPPSSIHTFILRLKTRERGTREKYSNFPPTAIETREGECMMAITNYIQKLLAFTMLFCARGCIVGTVEKKVVRADHSTESWMCPYSKLQTILPKLQQLSFFEI